MATYTSNKTTVSNVFAKALSHLKAKRAQTDDYESAPYDDEVFTTVDGKVLTFRQFNKIMYEHFENQRLEEMKSNYPAINASNRNA